MWCGHVLLNDLVGDLGEYGTRNAAIIVTRADSSQLVLSHSVYSLLVYLWIILDAVSEPSCLPWRAHHNDGTC